MYTKICNGKLCKGKEKLLSEFSKHSGHKDGLQSQCKECIKINDHLHYNENKEKILKRQKEYKEKYPEKIILNQINQRCNNRKTYIEKDIENHLTEKDVKFLMKRDNYYSLKNPSIDRKNNNENYILENCKFIELIENSCKDKRKIIFQYDLDGSFIKEWISLIQIEKELKIFHSGISKCANKKQLTAGGFKWRYKYE